MSFISKNIKKNYLLSPFSALYSSNPIDQFNFLFSNIVDVSYDSIVSDPNKDVNGFYAVCFSGGSSGQCPGPDLNDGKLIPKVVKNENKKFLAVKVKPSNESGETHLSVDSITNNSEKDHLISTFPWAVCDVPVEEGSISLKYGDIVFCKYADGRAYGFSERTLFISVAESAGLANVAANNLYNFSKAKGSTSVNFDNNTGLIKLDEFLPKIAQPDFNLIDKTNTPNLGKGRDKGANPGWTGFVLHYSVTYNVQDAIKVLQGRGVSYHYIIDYNGDIHQLVKDSQIAYHAGGSNGKNIGISFVQLGPHPQAGVTTQSRLVSKGIIDSTQTVESSWFASSAIKDYTHWQPFTNEQIISSIKLARHLKQKYPSIINAFRHSDVSDNGKMDPGPAFDLTNWKKLVFSENSPTPTATPATSTQSNNQNSNSDSSSIVDDAAALAESAFGAITSYFGS